jgi:hypothetical protein
MKVTIAHAVLLTLLLSLGLMAGPAVAFCPCYTLSSPNNINNCGIEAVPGTNPTVAAWNQIFQSVAQGPGAWGSAGPSVGSITTGCNHPQPLTSAVPVFPCELLQAMAMRESTWRQFCVPDQPSDQVGGSSRTIISQDCGYGALQITSGMHSGNTVPWDRSRVASDPFYNAATGALFLRDKWQATQCVGDNQPRIIEDWYTATWAYNSLSFTNSPNNPAFSSVRPIYDPAIGGSYPYQEKVWGWMEHPLSGAYWTALSPAYPNRGEIGSGGAPPAISEPSCAGPTQCTQTRPTHSSACLNGSAGPSVSLSANPTSISPGSSSTLTWSSSNATSCVASGGWSGSKSTSGSQSVTPSGTTTYTLTCSGAGGSASQSATVSVSGSTSPPAVYLSAFPQTVTPGTAVGLGWATSNATSCTASGGWSGSKALSGGETVFPPATTTYTLTCSGTGGSGSANVTVTVTSATPSVNLAVNPPAIDPGGTATLQWSTTSMTSCSGSGGWSGSKPLSGSQQVSPPSTTTYTLNCSGSAPASQQLVHNGGFSGIVTEWALSGKFFANSNFGSCNLTCPGYAYLSDPSGSLSLSNNLVGTMTQDISLPAMASSVALSFWVSVSTLETSTTNPFDVLSVSLLNTQGTPLQLVQTFSNLTPAGYRQTTFNLTPYKGQTVRLQFVGTTDATFGTVFRVDDVSVLASFSSQQYSNSTTLTVNTPSPPGLAFTATPDIVAPGQASTLAWTSGGTTSCTASNGWSGTKPTSGNQVVTPSVTTTYTLSCAGAGGTVTGSATVVVQSPPPTVTLSASPTSIQAGASSTLTWSSTNATSCMPFGAWASEGTKPTSGSEVVSPSQTATYVLSCTGSGGSATGSANVQVSSSPTCSSLTLVHTGSGSNPTASPSNSPGCSSGQYTGGASIQVTASPSSGWSVGSWSGTINNGSTSTINSVNMPTSNLTVTVNYVQAPPAPPILLVDDDDNNPDVRSFYTAALNALGRPYVVWDTANSDNEPGNVMLQDYQTVIWFTGQEFDGVTGPGASGEADLSSFLSGGDGRCMILSSQDYLFDRGTTSFMTNYLGLGSATNDVSQSTVQGQGSAFSGMGPYALSYPFTNFSDRISPAVGAELAFSGDQGDAAISRIGPNHRTIFLGFPFEALPTPQARQDVMAASLDYCATIFADVPPRYWSRRWIEAIYRAGVTSGCDSNPRRYCPEDVVTRGSMAQMLLAAKDGPSYVPPPCTVSPFSDVSASNPICPWVQELVRRGVTSGCGGGQYCPGNPVTRSQMSVFLLSTWHGPGYAPPPCTTSAFSDVPSSSPFCPWIQEMAARGITAGCGGGNFCTESPNTRAQLAVFLATTFGIPVQ